MDASFEITVLISLTVAVGIGSQVLAEYFRVPGIVFLLLMGILLGPSGLDWLHPGLLGGGLEVIVSLAVAIILFEGGLSLELRDLGRVSGSLRNLVSLGAFIAFVGGSLAAHSLAEFPWPIAFLYSALVVVTGPTVVAPLLKQVHVDRQVATLLEGEGVLIDPVGAILAVLVLDVVLNGDTDPLGVVTGLFLRLGLGLAVGGLGGWLLGRFITRANFLSEEIKNLVVLAGVWVLYSFSQFLVEESGLMTMVVAGLVMRASSLPEERLLRRFKSQLTVLAVSVLFVLLAADLSIPSIFALGWGSLGTVAVLMLVVRPINVWICTLNSPLNWRQKLFVSWIAPKGIISASVASLFSILLTERGINGGDAIKALVFLTIILTVMLQGLTARWLVGVLGLEATTATGVLIVGSNPLSRLIAQLFQDRGEAVVMIDTDAESCRLAENQGVKVFLSSALDTEVLEEAGLESMGTFLTMTSNGEVNMVLAQRAMEEFEPPRTLALLPREKTGTPTNKAKIRQAIAPDFPLKTWNKYLDDGEVKLGETVLEDHGFAFQKAHLQALIRSGELVPLLRERDGKLQVMSAADAWQKGDTIIYLLHAPKPKLLKRLSGSNHSTALKVEKLPEVEEVAVPASVRERANGQREEMAKRNPTEELKPTANDDNGQETLDKQGETPKGGKVQESPQFPNANESV
ncbi:cation:proton antiporter [Phormidium yuhuli AB48]|uniref:Cation:proton antiporter n=1 Tax=Phormidium yuhuli AB48 TaxID=2940671 RepID=A0ABY5AQ14_9CYAN|nr:cation:proton antiporter [Phormidium yuhuli]USR91303.1 cation:proton antiporter [Phormidium yuhuli AB48]